jgi:hypothetical protein
MTEQPHPPPPASRRPQPLALWLAGLLVATVVFFELVAGWVPGGGELLTDGELQHGLQAWQVSAGASASPAPFGGLVIESSSATAHAGIEQSFVYPEPCEYLQVHAELGVRNVVPGERGWQRARILLARRTKSGNWAVTTQPTLSFQGSLPVAAHEAVLPCPHRASRIYLRVELHQVPGRIELRSLSLKPVRESAVTVAGRWLAAAAWGLLGLALLLRLGPAPMASPARRPALWLAVPILIGVLIPASLRDALLTLVGLGGAEQGPGAMLAAPTTWGHALLFTLLAAALAAGRPALPLLRLAALLVSFALVSEVLQYFAPGRTPDLADLLVDLSGIAVGMLLGSCLGRLSARRRRLAPAG